MNHSILAVALAGAALLASCGGGGDYAQQSPQAQAAQTDRGNTYHYAPEVEAALAENARVQPATDRGLTYRITPTPH